MSKQTIFEFETQMPKYINQNNVDFDNQNILNLNHSKFLYFMKKITKTMNNTNYAIKNCIKNFKKSLDWTLINIGHENVQNLNSEVSLNL